jgi:hypothetical protein
MCSLHRMCSLIIQVRVLRGAIEDLRHELQQAEEHAAYVEGVSRECVYLRTYTHYTCIEYITVCGGGGGGVCVCR